MICFHLRRTARQRRRSVMTLTARTLVAALLGAALAALPPAAAQTGALRDQRSALGSAASSPVYQCPMHSHITSEEPGRCPICGMDLVAASPASAPPGVGDGRPRTVAIGPGIQQQLGVRLGLVERRILQRSVSAPARVVYDETRLLHIHPRAPGWIERLELRAEGEPVTSGQTLAELYSPEILAAQVNFIVALESAGATRQSRNARNLLRLLAVPEHLIQAIERDRETRTSIPIVAPGGGVLTRLQAREGMYVTADTEMFTIADLSTVWLLIDLRESESALVARGQHVEIALDALPGVTFEGRVDYLYPEIEEPARLRRARVVLANAEGRLQPGMFAQARIHSPSSDPVLAVERSAVLDDGEQQYVLRSLGDGRFQPVAVSTGRRGDAWIEVMGPLEPGERVATSAQFLIDAESDLQAELQRLDGGEPSHGGTHHEH